MRAPQAPCVSASLCSLAVFRRSPGINSRHPSVNLPAAISAVFAAIAATLLLAAPAFAAPRAFDTQITGQTPPNASVPGPFSKPRGVAIDAAGNVLVPDSNRAITTKYDPLGGYLSQLQLFNGNSEYAFAFNRLNGYSYRPHRNSVYIEILDSTGALSSLLSHGFGEIGDVGVAVDNSSETSQGRIYVSGTDVQSVQAFEPDGATEHTFSASASYISGNAITGTPGGRSPIPTASRPTVKATST